MAINTRSTLPALLVEGIKKNFGVGIAGFPSAVDTVFDMETSNKQIEIYQELGGFGRHKEKDEGSLSQLDVMAQGPETSIRNIAYALSYQITHEAIQDNLYKDILRKATSLGKSAAETKEAITFDRLNTAFSGAAADLIADGKALCATDHPLLKAPSEGAATNSNRPTTGSSLSEASLVTDMNNIAAFKDPAGLKIFVQGMQLVVPQALDVDAQKLLQTDLTVGSANNDINPFGRNRGRIPKGHITVQFLTDNDSYFIRTSMPGLVHQSREAIRIMEDLLQRQMVNEVVSYMRFGVGAYDHRSIYGNPGS